ncbi:hypothetical protein WS70_25090 [Burkholderia mayonis]|uniref:Uncharacterized protein n=1 Tax=Burkholderia mayonis TaxID=1385591 RepID=A0A1B4FMW9_9BURK|nr:hypothetical protein WS70_25090 [Burkholderia mayonis]KVE45710.1 hypothetical protein WS70_03705 [Burkholderia mayonis]
MRGARVAVTTIRPRTERAPHTNATCPRRCMATMTTAYGMAFDAARSGFRCNRPIASRRRTTRRA